MAHGDAQEGKWRGNCPMKWVASTLHTTSERGVTSITTADAQTSAASSRLNWGPCRFKWTRPFRRKTKSGFCACVITFQLASTYILTPWCRVVLEKLTGLQLVRKIPAFHGTRRLITAFTSVRQLSLAWASPIQSIYPHPTFWRSILILSNYLRQSLPSGLLPSGFPTKSQYTPLSSPIRATFPAHLILNWPLH